MSVSPEEFQTWLLSKQPAVRYAKVNKSLASTKQIERYLPSNYQVIEDSEDYLIVAGVDVGGWTLGDYVIPRLSSGLITASELKGVTVEVYHNVSRDSFFGLNTVFRRDMPTTPDSAKRQAKTDEERHPLVKVFEYRTYLDFDLNVCERAFAAFNGGSDREDERYFTCNLRSLSVGDVVIIDGEPYSCESAGFKRRDRAELRIITDFDPVAAYGRRGYTVPWEGK